eukprot:658909-Rhodomonas_salina.6
MPGPDIDYVNLWPTRWVLGKWCPVLTDTGLVPGVLAYATAMRFPVLRCAIRYRVTANGVCQATSGTRTRPMVHDCHEMSGTDVGYAPTRNTGTQYGKASRNPGKKCDGSMQVEVDMPLADFTDKETAFIVAIAQAGAVQTPPKLLHTRCQSPVLTQGCQYWPTESEFLRKGVRHTCRSPILTSYKGLLCTDCTTTPVCHRCMALLWPILTDSTALLPVLMCCTGVDYQAEIAVSDTTTRSEVCVALSNSTRVRARTVRCPVLTLRMGRGLLCDVRYRHSSMRICYAVLTKVSYAFLRALPRVAMQSSSDILIPLHDVLAHKPHTTYSLRNVPYQHKQY